MYAELLTGTLSERTPRREVVRILFRHLAVALLGEVGCQVALRRPEPDKVIRDHLAVAGRYARAVFAQTVGDDPARFLCPGLARHGVSVEFLAELFRQASHAGAVDRPPCVNSSDLIEAWRGRLHAASDPFRASTLARMRASVADAVGAVEEVNRLRGFALLVGRFDEQGTSFAERLAIVRREIAARQPNAADRFAYIPDPV